MITRRVTVVTVEVRFAKITRDQEIAIIANERTLHVSFQYYCYLDIFTKIKLVFKNTDSMFCMYSVIYALC